MTIYIITLGFLDEDDTTVVISSSFQDSLWKDIVEAGLSLKQHCFQHSDNYLGPLILEDVKENYYSRGEFATCRTIEVFVPWIRDVTVLDCDGSDEVWRSPSTGGCY
jgi:hypothetical protein